MTFNDIFTSSFLDRFDAVPLTDAIVAMVLACALGLFILLIYRKTYHGVMYSEGFGLSLVVITLVTTLVILAVWSNVLLSLGMVGALSIVRFRAPIKEPLDIVYLFWCIATGIVLAAGLLFLAIFGCVFIGLVLLVFSSRTAPDSPYMLVVRCSDDEVEKQVAEKIGAACAASALKAKAVTGEGAELTYEVRLGTGGSEFVGGLCAIEGVSDATLVSYNGDYQG